MMNNNHEGLEVIIDEYSKLEQVDFATLIRWESQIHDPFELLQIYDRIVMDYTLSSEGAPRKTLEAGLLGYIKGQKMNATDRAERLATTDSLTGLPNDRVYQGMLEMSLSRATREKYGSSGKYVALIFIDVNKFKEEANDRYGHKFGDEILQYVAEALKSETRTTDGKIRLGGDEFLIILDPLDAENTERFLLDLTQKINSNVQKQISTNHPGKRPAISVSLGMSIYGIDARTKEELMSHADDAMYFAKLNPVTTPAGPVNCHIYNPKSVYIKKEERKGRI